MSILLHFLLGCAVSFIGSLPMGLINLTIAETAISRGIRAALMLGLGAVLVEWGQILLALFFADWFFDNDERQFWMRVVGAAVFLVLGIFYLVKKTEPPHLQTDTETRKHRAFLRGVGLSAVNMLAIPFWLVQGAWLQAQGWLSDDNLLILVFSVGAIAGTYGLFVAYAKLGLFVLNRAKKISEYASRIIGIIFLALGLWQVTVFIAG